MNTKISALPLTTGSTNNDFLVKNNSGETTTSKVALKHVMGMTSINGNNSIQSSKYLTLLGTTATTESTIAIGNGAEATSPYAIAIGYKARNPNRDGTRDKYIAIGFEARSITDGVAIGSDARCNANGGFAIGNQTRVFGNGGFALGEGAESYGTDGLVIGNGAKENPVYGGTKGIAIGSNTIIEASDSIAIGTGVLIYSGSTNSIAIGKSSEVTALNAIVIGHSGHSIHTEGIVIGHSLTSSFSKTLKTKSIQSTGQIFNGVQTLASGTTFNIDFNLGASVQFTTSGNATAVLTNVRDGAKYRLKVKTTGNQTLTMTAAGFNFIYENGGLPLTNNGTSLVTLDVFSTTIMVSHTLAFS